MVQNMNAHDPVFTSEVLKYQPSAAEAVAATDRPSLASHLRPLAAGRLMASPQCSAVQYFSEKTNSMTLVENKFSLSNMSWLLCRKVLGATHYGIELRSYVMKSAKENLESLIKNSDSFDN